MITVTKRRNGFTVEGHAGFAERGKDIVCAGVSTLAQTFIASVESLTDDRLDYTIVEKNGFLDVEYRELTEKSKTLLASFFIGCQMVADEYPDNVKVKCSGKKNK
jgi:uncharacterized protein YsxB (DUF464 family)